MHLLAKACCNILMQTRKPASRCVSECAQTCNGSARGRAAQDFGDARAPMPTVLIEAAYHSCALFCAIVSSCRAAKNEADAIGVHLLSKACQLE
jgi:hypothetical protein